MPVLASVVDFSFLFLDFPIHEKKTTKKLEIQHGA